MMGKWLGVASKVCQAMTYWILTSKGTVVARSSVAHFTEQDRRNDTLIREQEMFLSKVCELKNYDPLLKGPNIQP